MFCIPDFRIFRESFLDKTIVSKFEERPYIDHSCFLTISMYPNDRKNLNSGSLGTLLLSPKIFSESYTNPQNISTFFKRIEEFEAYINQTGLLSIRRLKTEEIVGNEEQVGILEYYLSLTNDNGLLRDLDFKNGIKIGNEEVRYYTVSDSSQFAEEVPYRSQNKGYSSDKHKFYTSAGLVLGLELSCNHIYNQYIFLDNTSEMLEKLAKNARFMTSFSTRDAMNEKNAKNNTIFLQLVTEGAIPCRSHINVMTWANTKEKLNANEKLVSSAFRKLGNIRAKDNQINIQNLFWGGIPGNGSDIPNDETFITTLGISVNLFNYESNTPTSTSKLGIRLCDRRFGIPRLVDLSYKPLKKKIIDNLNKFIIGPSGSGKSFFTNHALRHYYQQGSHIVIVDKGHSYRKICEELGGMYLTFDETNLPEFNPFNRKVEKFTDEKKENLIVLLQTLWKGADVENLDNAESKVLSDSILAYNKYLDEHPDTFGCFDSYYEFFRDVFVNVLKEKDVLDLFNVKSYLFTLETYYQKGGGEFGYLLNSRKNLDAFSERFIIFEMDNIANNTRLYPIITLMLMDTFMTKMRQLPRNVRKILLMEETWKALMDEKMGEFIKYAAKTFRKFMAELWCVTQEANDLLDSPIVKGAIIVNSDTKIIMDMKKYEQKTGPIQEMLGLTDKQIMMVTSINKNNHLDRGIYKEVFIAHNLYSCIYAIEVSFEELAVYTTEPTEMAEVDKCIDRFNGDRHLGYRQFAENFAN